MGFGILRYSSVSTLIDVVPIIIDLQQGTSNCKAQIRIHFTIGGFWCLLFSKRPYKVFQSFRECFYCQKSREISVPATSQVTHFFEISPCVRERNFFECMLAVFSPFSLIYILASLLRVPSSPQFGALVETGGQKGSQIRAGDH